MVNEVLFFGEVGIINGHGKSVDRSMSGEVIMETEADYFTREYVCN